MRNSRKLEGQDKTIPTSSSSLSSSLELMGFRDRLKEAIGGEPVRSFGERCGLSKGVLYNYLNGSSYPTLDRLQDIADAAEKHISFFLSIREQVAEDARTANIDNNFVLIPCNDLRYAPGNKNQPFVDSLAFNRAWLDAMHLQADSLTLIVSRDDSMYPTIREGSLLLVDMRKDQIIQDAIYVLRLEGALRVKRLQHFIDGGVLVKCDNPLYHDMKADKDQVPSLDIVGRVVWRGGKP